MSTPTTTQCRDCGHDSGGRPRCQPCGDAFRRSVDYRATGLSRDGYWCQTCRPWWNRLLVPTADRDTGRLRLVFALWAWLTDAVVRRSGKWRTRRVQVDHIRALGNDGDHAKTNLQVLCTRHHDAKTARDVAQMKGRREPVDRARAARWVLGTVAVAAVAFQLLDEDMRFAFRVDPANGLRLLATRAGDPAVFVPLGLLAVVVVTGLALRQLRARTVERLAVAVGSITGAPVTDKRAIRVRRWGRVGKAIRPVDVEVRYPRTFADNDPAQVEKVDDRVRSKLGWTSSRVDVDPSRDRMRLRFPDPFVTAPPTTCPLIGRASWDLVAEGLPVAVDERFKDVRVDLVERNLLVGGEPGAGKSNVLSIILAAAGLDREVDLWLIDGKKVEFAAWESLAEEHAIDMESAITLLTNLQAVIEQRYDVMRAEGKRKVEPGDGHGLILLAIDELASFTAGGFQKQVTDKFVGLLRDILQRGRAAGVMAVLATQRPAAEVVPTSIRDIVSFRWALRCMTPSSSDMVLGQGLASLGHNAARIPAEARGTGLLMAEGGFPKKVRAHYVDDAALDQLAAAARDLRGVPAPTGLPEATSTD